MKDKNLESGLKRLDEISKLMDNDDLPLETALKLYAEAKKLIEGCKEEMADAQASLRDMLTGFEA